MVVDIDLDIKTLKNINENEMYNYLREKLEKVINKYSFLEVSDKELCKFFKAKIRFIKVDSYLKFLNLELEKYFNQVLQSKIKENPYLIVEKFIKYNLKETNNFKDSIIYLKKLKGFLVINKIEIQGLFERLIKENKVIINLLYNISRAIEKDKTLARYLDSNTLKELVDLFCLNNNIDLNLDININYITKRKTDSLDSYDLYITEVSNIPLLTEEMERELFIKYRNGDNEAKKKIIVSNLRLVVKLARRLYHENSKYTFLDLVDEGNTGLVYATSLYDLEYGTRFTTFAYHWINRYMLDYIKRQSRLVHIPLHMYSKLFKLIKLKEENPGITEKEIATRLGIKEKEVLDLLKFSKEVISLNRKTNDEDDTELEDIALIDYKASDEFNKVEKTLDFESIISNVSNLTEREKLILKCIYKEEKSYTLIEKETGISKTMIRFIHEKALRKIRRDRDLIFNLASLRANPIESIRNLGYEDFEFKEYNNDREDNSKIGRICKMFLDFRKISKRYYLVSKFSYRDIIILSIKLGIFGNIQDEEIASYFEIDNKKILDIFLDLQPNITEIKEFLKEFGSYLYKTKSDIQVQNIRRKINV